MFKYTILGLSLIFAIPVQAQDMSAFHAGAVIPEFGPIASIDSDVEIPIDAKFKISFDVGKKADAGQINRSLIAAARFINMQAEAGVKPENIRLAIVVHGKASHDLTIDDYYGAHSDGAKNANVTAIATLLKNGVEIHLCGQSAAAYGIGKSDLLPGVKMSLSAMTSHALLQQKGYTLNPF